MNGYMKSRNGTPVEIVDVTARAAATHTNKAVLDGITAAKVAAWDVGAGATDEHINALINAALGVVENGTY